MGAFLNTFLTQSLFPPKKLLLLVYDGVLPASELGLGALPQHIRDDEESDMTSSYVNLIQMTDSAVARGNSDVFQLNIHIVLGYRW